MKVMASVFTVRQVRPRRILLVVMSWAVAASLGVAVIAMTASSAATSGSGGTRTSAAGSPGPINYNQPFLGGNITTIASAEAAVGFKVPLPSSPAANQATLTRVWVNRQHQVALVFGRGRMLVMMLRAIYRDPATFFKKSRPGINAKTAVMQVNGNPVLVITPHTDPVNPNPAWVEFSQHGIDINIVSAGYGTRTLLAAAASMMKHAT